MILTMMNITGTFAFYYYHITFKFIFFYYEKNGEIDLCIFLIIFCSFVHGRLPYENLKPDPILRNLLLSLPYRKLVSFLKMSKKNNLYIIRHLNLLFFFQTVTNGQPNITSNNCL
jgi:hypothetical protein